MLVPWPMAMYRPGSNVRVITLAIDPIHRMTSIYEFPTDLAIGGDAGPSIPLLLEEVRSAMTPPQRERCRQRSARLQAEGLRARTASLEAASAERTKDHITPAWLSSHVGPRLHPDT